MTIRIGKQFIGTLAIELISTGCNLPPKCHFQPFSDGNDSRNQARVVSDTYKNSNKAPMHCTTTQSDLCTSEWGAGCKASIDDNGLAVDV